jgi:hypothetical protein
MPPTQRLQEHATTTELPNVRGGWELLWKDKDSKLLRTRLNIRQDGNGLTIRPEDADLLKADSRKFIYGTIRPATISFRVQPRSGEPIVFTGMIDGGIMYGTTSKGLSWMAVRHPD